ncbi:MULTISPECIES: ImmA/IrrE family metallo-endopeptidase [unclassified Rhizobium]|uniref:ImmA/IrrE family metallo-endopeptidase n=1 Tax=unclassified Rhizobium TaxID=2613769 RepID=UPI001782F188|nr:MULTISPECIES: ImmA/IrrE family metallo-endopeptidase [unclassified Rhizobium]MBD8689553.1 ImmA/IrrE family metallo-endopeptidase [Rhizobium sp. CFBP 13644]MBD8693925.1 ImmA/IrrE family metallo-endopeptidase [Rhizobium sp. CFBP 13717]
MNDIAGAVRLAVLEANRLHRDLGIQARVIRGNGRVDVYDAISRLDVPLFFTKLDGLLGAYYRHPSPGILVTTERPLNQQRFTAAHELGHHWLGHAPSIDDTHSALRRMPFQQGRGDNIQEIGAETFAASFLLPRWLLDWHCERQDWTDDTFSDPIMIYQLALRVGVSYAATVWTLQRYGVFDRNFAFAAAAVEVKELKKRLLRGYKPTNYRGDVWLVTESDERRPVHGGPLDLLVVKLREQSGGGYLWRVKTIDDEALAIVDDEREMIPDSTVGSPTLRVLTASARGRYEGVLALSQARPWQPAEVLSSLQFHYDFHGAHSQGWYKDQRDRYRDNLAAA